MCGRRDRLFTINQVNDDMAFDRREYTKFSDDGPLVDEIKRDTSISFTWFNALNILKGLLTITAAAVAAVMIVNNALRHPFLPDLSGFAAGALVGAIAAYVHVVLFPAGPQGPIGGAGEQAVGKLSQPRRRRNPDRHGPWPR
jgi:hypothetical protein